MKKICFIIVLLAVCISQSCSAHTKWADKEFYVVGKEFVPEHTSFNIATLSNDTVKEAYVVIIADSVRTWRAYVSKKTYNSYKKGDRFDLDDLLSNQGDMLSKRIAISKKTTELATEVTDKTTELASQAESAIHFPKKE